MRLAPLVLLAALLGPPAATAAGPADVVVRIGPVLEARSASLGPEALLTLAEDLRGEVRSALRGSRALDPVRVDLVIEDAAPNRPTAAQLSRTAGLSPQSLGLGGARVSGTAVYADGSARPLREQFFETRLSDDRGADTWFDADRLFQKLAYDLARGRLPDRFTGPGPSGVGDFGAARADR